MASAASGSNVIIYAGLVNVMIPISLSSVSVTARVVLRVIPKPTSNSALTASQRAIVRSLPKIVSNSANNAISRLQGRYLPSAASSSNAIVVSVIASTFRSFPAVYSISAVSPEPVLNIPIILNAISSGQVIMAFVETPRATSLSILNAATRTVQRISAFVSSGSVALYPAVGVLQPKPVLLTASSGNVTSRSAFRPQVACSSSGKAATNSKQFYSARRTTSSSSLSVVVGKIILRPHPISLSSSQATCAKRAEVRVPVNSLSLSKAAKSPEMRVIMRVSVNSLSSSSENAIVEVSFAILAAFYPELSSFTNAMAFTRGLKIFAGGAINSSELEVVVIDDLMD